MSSFHLFNRFMRKNRIKGFTLWQRNDGSWQVNAQNPDGSWRIKYADIPSEGISEIMESYERTPAHIIVEPKPEKLVPEQAQLDLPKKRSRRSDDFL